MTLPLLILHQNPSQKIVKLVNEHKLKTVRKGRARDEDFKNTTDKVCEENFPRPGQQRNVAGKLLLLSTRAYNRVQQSCMGLPNEYNILQHRGRQKKCCIVQHLFSEKFDRDQTSYNTIQHDTTRWPNEYNILYNIKVV